MSAGLTLASSFISVRKFPPGPEKERERVKRKRMREREKERESKTDLMVFQIERSYP